MSSSTSLVSSTQEVETSEIAEIALATYHNFIEAWSLLIKSRFPEDKTYTSQIQNKPAYSGITSGKVITDELSHCYYRGKLTVIAMEYLPIKTHPELVLSSNYWLPVQAYYAVHGMGKAAAIALGQTAPDRHNAFCHYFSDMLSTYFPYPFNIRCKGNIEENNLVFENTDTTIEEVTATSLLYNTYTDEEVERIVAKSIKTTRERSMKGEIDWKRVKIRNKGKRRNLNHSEKLECCDRFVHPTSLCDFLYRLRIRTNYDNPDMYVLASRDIVNETEYYANLLYLIQMIVKGLEVLIQRCIGEDAMSTLTGAIKNCQSD